MNPNQEQNEKPAPVAGEQPRTFAEWRDTYPSATGECINWIEREKGWDAALAWSKTGQSPAWTWEEFLADRRENVSDEHWAVEDVRAAWDVRQQEVERLREALKRIATCQDAPDIDATGDWQKGLHCGVEDRDCQDRYQGADYGHAVGVEKGLEWASNEAKAALGSNDAPATTTETAGKTTGDCPTAPAKEAQTASQAFGLWVRERQKLGGTWGRDDVCDSWHAALAWAKSKAGTDAEIETFLRECDEGKHPLTEVGKEALSKAAEKLAAIIGAKSEAATTGKD